MYDYISTPMRVHWCVRLYEEGRTIDASKSMEVLDTSTSLEVIGRAIDALELIIISCFFKLLAVAAFSSQVLLV